MLAGTDECEGEWIKYADTHEKKSLKYFMACPLKAKKSFGDGLRSYRSSEGRVKEVPYKGKAELIVNDILGGVRNFHAYTELLL